MPRRRPDNSADARTRLAETAKLRDANPLDQSDEFHAFILACRQGDLAKCQECINHGANINGRDDFDYTPLIIASLCGHYELVQLLLESGANAERNTFQGERCIYNALNNEIRNLLLQYDFSKTSDPYVYWSSHISSLLTRTTPRTSDLCLTSGSRPFHLHRFLLASRTPYFGRKLLAQPDTSTWALAGEIPAEAVQIALRHIYLSDLPRDLVPPGSSLSEEEVLAGLDGISNQLGVDHGWDADAAGDRRLARQRFRDEEERALNQLAGFFRSNVLANKVVVDADRVSDVKWRHDNPAFADVLLRADEAHHDGDEPQTPLAGGQGEPGRSGAPPSPKKPSRSVLYPVHKAMLIRSGYFERMFSGEFVESQRAEHLRVITVDFLPAVLELVLTHLYAETPVIPLEHALDVLYAADMLFLDNLKTKAAQAISTLGNRAASVPASNSSSSSSRSNSNHDDDKKTQDEKQDEQQPEVEPINIYDVVHAAWDLGVRRLEEFAARYLAHRLEDYIDDPEFHNLIRESAARIRKRDETDTIELLDDIRHYLSDRFRLRFDDPRLDQMLMVDDAANGPDGDAATAESAPPADTAADTFAAHAINHQLFLDKIDAMLETLRLSA